MSTKNTDRIEEKILLRVPLARVWRALTDAEEFGFDGIPDARRAEAYRMHEEGWAAQMKSIERYLAKAA